jgi:hypothetical protein
MHCEPICQSISLPTLPTTAELVDELVALLRRVNCKLAEHNVMGMVYMV